MKELGQLTELKRLLKLEGSSRYGCSELEAVLSVDV
jgi:hypothetical protein